MINPKLKEGLNKLQNSFIHPYPGAGFALLAQARIKSVQLFTRLCLLRCSTSCIHAVVDAGIHQHNDKDT